MSDPYTIAGHIRRDLLKIRDHYDAAGDPPKAADDGAKGGGRPDRPPLDLHAVDVRQEAHHDLAYYTRFILDVVNDGTITTQVDGSDVHELAQFVDRWALALAEQHPDDAQQCRADMAKHARRLRTLACGIRVKRVEVGRCPEVDLTLDERGVETLRRCEGTIVATLRERDPDDEDDGLLPEVIKCTDLGHTWHPSQWRDLGSKLGTTILPVAVDEAAVMLGCSGQHVLNLVARGVLTNVGEGRKFMILPSEVREAIDAGLISVSPRRGRRSA